MVLIIITVVLINIYLQHCMRSWQSFQNSIAGTCSHGRFYVTWVMKPRQMLYFCYSSRWIALCQISNVWLGRIPWLSIYRSLQVLKLQKPTKSRAISPRECLQHHFWRKLHDCRASQYAPYKKQLKTLDSFCFEFCRSDWIGETGLWLYLTNICVNINIYIYIYTYNPSPMVITT